ncbi:MAG: hypothetical protein ACM3PY_21760 [Omnitrophica WOR_2 bacterium]
MMLTQRSIQRLIIEHEMPEVVQDLKDQARKRWYDTSTELPELGPVYTLQQQRANERELDRRLNSLYKLLKRPQNTSAEKNIAQEAISAAMIYFAQTALGLGDQDIAAIRSYGFAEVAVEFAQKARQFQKDIRDEDIYQASRNVWSMNFMQILLGLPVSLTPSIFAFSMLYPLSDNYLDNPAIPQETKESFNRRFNQRLAGNRITPANEQEQSIDELIGMIEGQYDRTTYPGVFHSLQAIHQAQARSLALLRKNASPYEMDVLGICFEKGGTSVVADGYLVAGNLDDKQRAFMYLYGVLTQLIDDLEDTRLDLKSGLMTVFSQTARSWPLDQVASRTFRMADQLVDAMDVFNASGSEPFKYLLHRCLRPVMIASMGSLEKYFSRPYVQELQRHFPYRFSFLIHERDKLARQGVTIMGLVETFAHASHTGPGA